MADVMKHVGSVGDKPCVVVFREVPNEPENCLIVETGSLEDQKHDDLMSVVSSLEAQESNDISEVLARRQFTDGSNMLNELHFGKKLTKMAVNMVNLTTPTPGQFVPLEDVNKEIRKLAEGTNPPLNTEVSDTQPESASDPLSSASPEFAKTLMYEASLLERDSKQMLVEADIKRKEAYALDPSLEPKKGPGRPKKEA
jgi:hypothetical protein